MIKIILSVIFAGISIVTFIFYTKPLYAEQKLVAAQLDRYDAALSKANLASAKMDALTSLRNQIPQSEKDKLNVLMPVNAVDNIQLILDIEGIAKKYDVTLKKVDISYKANQGEEEENTIGFNMGPAGSDLQKNLEVSFEMDATYDDFLNFLVDLEHSMRIVDIVSLSFDSNSLDSASANVFDSGLQDSRVSQGEAAANKSARRYTFQVALRTYWVDVK